MASIRLLSKDVEFDKFTQTPTQKLKKGFWIFSYQEIGSSLISLEMIFEALQSELFRFKFHILNSKILKILEFNLCIRDTVCVKISRLKLTVTLKRKKVL